MQYWTEIPRNALLKSCMLDSVDLEILKECNVVLECFFSDDLWICYSCHYIMSTVYLSVVMAGGDVTF